MKSRLIYFNRRGNLHRLKDRVSLSSLFLSHLSNSRIRRSIQNIKSSIKFPISRVTLESSLDHASSNIHPPCSSLKIVREREEEEEMGGTEEIEMRDRGCKKHEKSLRGVAQNPEEGNQIKIQLKSLPRK